MAWLTLMVLDRRDIIKTSFHSWQYYLWVRYMHPVYHQWRTDRARKIELAVTPWHQPTHLISKDRHDGEIQPQQKEAHTTTQTQRKWRQQWQEFSFKFWPCQVVLSSGTGPLAPCKLSERNGSSRRIVAVGTQYETRAAAAADEEEKEDQEQTEWGSGCCIIQTRI